MYISIMIKKLYSNIKKNYIVIEKVIFCLKNLEDKWESCGNSLN